MVFLSNAGTSQPGTMSSAIIPFSAATASVDLDYSWVHVYQKLYNEYKWLRDKQVWVDGTALHLAYHILKVMHKLAQHTATTHATSGRALLLHNIRTKRFVRHIRAITIQISVHCNCQSTANPTGYAGQSSQTILQLCDQHNILKLL